MAPNSGRWAARKTPVPGHPKLRRKYPNGSDALSRVGNRFRAVHDAYAVPLRCGLHSDLAEVDDGRVVRAGELLVFGNFSQIATGYDDHSV